MRGYKIQCFTRDPLHCYKRDSVACEVRFPDVLRQFLNSLCTERGNVCTQGKLEVEGRSWQAFMYIGAC